MIARWMGELQLATCLPFLLEAGYSARSGTKRSAMMADLVTVSTSSRTQRVRAGMLNR